MEEDYWRIIEGFAAYRISRDGEVQSRWSRGYCPAFLTDDWRSLKPVRKQWGHQVVHISNGERRVFRMVHHLVLEAFEGPRPEGLVCCHNDGNASNNRLENLRWDTHLSNTLDKAKHGTQPRGEKMNTAKLKEWQVLEIRRLHSEGVPVPRLAKEYGVRSETIRKVIKRQSWTHLP